MRFQPVERKRRRQPPAILAQASQELTGRGRFLNLERSCANHVDLKVVAFL